MKTKQWEKLQADIIKAMMADTVDQHYRVSWNERTEGEGREMLVIVDGLYLVVVPEAFWCLNTDMLPKEGIAAGFARRFLNEAEKVDRVLRITDERKGTGADALRKFVFETRAISDVWVSERLLKAFDLTDCEYRAADHKSPVIIVKNGHMEGFIMPVVKQNEEETK